MLAIPDRDPTIFSPFPSLSFLPFLDFALLFFLAFFPFPFPFLLESFLFLFLFFYVLIE